MRKSIAKKTISCGAAIALAVMGLPAAAFAEGTNVGETFSVDGVTYTVTSSTEVSVGAQSASGKQFASDNADVVIPATVSGYTVTGINNYAFSDGVNGSTTLKSITLPNTITSIGSFAFLGCDGLTSVSIPGSVTKIKSFAFCNCKALKSVKFEKGAATLSIGESAFAISGLVSGGALESIEIPSRLATIPERAFENQGSLKAVTCESRDDTLGYIGSYAFRNCEGLVSIEIPSLTSETSTIGTQSFYYCKSLNSITFFGDESYGVSSGTFTIKTMYDEYYTATIKNAPIKQIVYYGNHTSNLYTAASGALHASHYQRIAYCSGGSASGSTVGEVFVRDDVALKDLVDKQGKSDSEGAFVLSGSVPQTSSGKVWFYGENALSKGASGFIKAYQVDANDLTYGDITLDEETAIYTGAPVAPVYTAYAPDGSLLKPGVDYDIEIQDENGAAVQGVELNVPGTYSVVAKGKGSYRGSCRTPFVLDAHQCTIVRCNGNATIGQSGTHMAQSAFVDSEVDTLIVASSSNPAVAAAAAGLAGTLNAPIVFTDEDSLSMEALFHLNRYKPESVLLVGMNDASIVLEKIKSEMGNTSKVSNAFVGSTQAEMAYAAYKRTKSAGYWDDSTTVYIASCDDVASAAVAGSYAYRTASPVFLLGSDGTLPQEAAKALVGGDFSNIVLVGYDDASQAFGQQLTAVGYSGGTSYLQAANSYELSMKAAQEQIDAGLCGYDKVTFVDPDDEQGMACAAAACGQNKSAMLLVDDSANGSDAIDRFVRPNVYEIETVYLFGTRSRFSAFFESALEDVWAVKDNMSLKWATAHLSESKFSYDGEVKSATVDWVRSANGDLLVADTDYRVRFYNDSTDKMCLASKLKDAGVYTVCITGLNDYTGIYYLSLEIAPIALTSSDIKVEKNSCDYTGSVVTPQISVAHAGTALTEGVDYVVKSTAKEVGSAEAVVEGKGNYSGSFTVNYTITKATQKITAKTSAVTLSAKNLKKKAATVTIGASAVTKLSYKTSNKAVKVDSKGKVVVAKGTKKGTYKVTITAAATSYYKSATKVVTIKVK